ncbi:MAG: hypothetical protein Q8P01_02350 [bacterium]|nr:hypothetical protein [bacterium]
MKLRIKNYKLRDAGGQVMIEAIVAISMVTIGLLGIITLLINSSRWNRNVSHELVATYLAAEGIEIVKNFIDTNIAGRLSGDNMATWNGGLDEDAFYEVQYDAAFGGDGRLPGTPGARQVSPGNVELLKYDIDTHTYGYGSGEESPFRRVLEIVEPVGSDDMLLVSSTVSFEGQDGVQNVHLESVFTHWRKLGSGL